MTVTIHQGDCREILYMLPTESVHCVVTSPPYWGLRDYGIDGQLGLEASLGEHVAVIVDVFRQVRRVLRKDGTLWLNYGDSYATSPAGNKGCSIDDRFRPDKMDVVYGGNKPFSTVGPISRVGISGNKGNGGADHGHRNTASGYLKPKDLCGIPWRVAFALQEDGWWLRQDIIWSKPNPMPESVTDRCTKAHEYIFLMSKNERYYYDAAAIAEPAGYDLANTKFPDGWDTGAGGHGSFHRNGREKGRAAGYKSHKYVTEYLASDSEKHRTKAGLMKIADVAYATRNKRSVWEVATQPFSDAHFATFPPALIEPCILAGCPKGGTVLDLFGGAGTTGLVADRLGRNAILIELNPEYAAMAERRIKNDAPLFADVLCVPKDASP